MMKTISILHLIIVPLSVAVTLAGCQKEESKTGSVQLEITDAPIDDARVNAVFVTIAGVEIDGEPMEGFNTTTTDLTTYVQGDTKTLANSEMEAGSYNSIRLILDFSEDENGISPGCYVEETDTHEKHSLRTNSGEIILDHSFDVEVESQTNLVIDFDLRKCVRRERGENDSYEFVTASEMENSIRVVNKEMTGTVAGNCEDLVTNSDLIVAYAYVKGTFDRDSEFEGLGESGVMFSNAATSAQVLSNGDYSLHFLSEGEYELHFCSFELNADEEMVIQGTLNLNVLSGGIDTGSVQVDARATTTVDVEVTGLLPFLETKKTEK